MLQGPAAAEVVLPAAMPYSGRQLPECAHQAAHASHTNLLLLMLLLLWVQQFLMFAA
jgi:hypothetical protein